MNWVSRLLPHKSSLPWPTRPVHVSRRVRCRRGRANLETLEGRTLLSNVVTSFAHDPATGANTLIISGDAHNDTFSVTENADGTVTLVGTPRTTINATELPYTTTQAIGNITISLPGTTTNTDQVTMTGLGKGTATTVRNVSITVTGTTALTLSVNNVNNSGTLTLADGTSTVAGGGLHATVDNSHFTALSIYETGCCQTSVELGNDSIPGAVSVTEGVADGNSITVDKGDSFGSTVLRRVLAR